MIFKKQSYQALIIKPILVFTLLCLVTTKSYSQRWPHEMWHDGRIVLLQGDTLKGLIKYDLTQDIVQIAFSDKTVEAFSSRKILFFEIFDNTVHKYRQFYALPYTTVGSYKTPIFFELLEEGKLTLLTRESLELRTYSAGFYGGSYQRVELVNNYFFLEENGNINPFTGNKNELMSLMGKKGSDVEKYMKSNRLKMSEKYDFARIINYYNSLVGPS